MYGPTETTIWSTIFQVQPAEGVVPIGRPIGNTQCYILDSHLQPVPVGVPGELHIGGDGLARGYLNRPELTTEKFIPDPFSDKPDARLYKTGDLARYLPNGNIEFLNRIDHQIKIRGFRVELGELEAVLVQHPSVREVVALVREDSPGDKRLIAYIIPSQTPPPPINELRHFLQQTLPNYMVPSAFVMLEALPLTPNGKVDRKALPEPDLARPEPGETFATPSNPIEPLIAEIWQDLLRVEQVSVYDNFFDLGGHSLLVMQVIARIENELGVQLNPGDFVMQTLGQVAALCQEKQRLPQSSKPETFPQKLWDMVRNTVSRKV
jgi:acyl carrier protein